MDERHGVIAPLTTVTVSDIELQLLLEAVYRFSGYDFRDYAAATVKRRIAERVRSESVRTVSGLQEKVLHEAGTLDRLVYGLSVNPSSMFREPSFFHELRNVVMPRLRTFPFLRLWVLGCATGDEAYSLAILMKELNLYHRCKIYATDISELAIEQAREGRIPVEQLEDIEARYREGGGTRAFADYVKVDGLTAVLDPSLRENIVFSTYNLASDGSFNEFQFITCRNLMTHYNKSLAYRAHQIILESLSRFGYLALGSKETLRFTPHQRCYEEAPGSDQLYRRIR